MPTLTEEAYKEYETKVFIKSVHNGSVKSFIATLVKDGSIDAAEIAEIRNWLHEKADEI